MGKTIHIHLDRIATKDNQKPYVSSTKEAWEVLGNKGQTVKTFPKTDKGRQDAQKYLKDNFETLTKDSAEDKAKVQNLIEEAIRFQQKLRSCMTSSNGRYVREAIDSMTPVISALKEAKGDS